MSCTEIVCGTGIGNITKPGDPDNTSVLSAVGVSGGINVSWTYPTINPYAVAYVDVYRSDSNSIFTAVKRIRISGDFFFDRIPDSEIKPYYYWIKIISINGTEGEFIGPASAIPGSSLQDILDKINGILDESALSAELRAKLEKIPLIEYDLASEVSKRLLQDATMGEALAAVQSETGQALTYIQDEITQRTNAQEALLNSVNTLTVGMEGNAAAIVSEQTARVTADTALAADITSLYTSVGNNASAISTEIQTRTNETSALAQSVTNLTAVAGAKNKTFSQPIAPAAGISTTGDLWFDTDDNNKTYRFNGTSWVESSDTRIAANMAAITSEATARADGDSAIASSVTTLTAAVNLKTKTYRQALAPTVGMSTGDLWFDTDDGNKAYRYSGTVWEATDDARIATNLAAISSEATTRADADAAMASTISTIQSQLGTTGSIGSAIIAAQNTATTANTAANTAQTTANTALSKIDDITSDNVLSALEKSSVRSTWNDISSEKAGINGQATAYNITTENTTYNTKFQALATYLNNNVAWSSGIPSWIVDANLGTNTVIDGAVFRTRFNEYYSARTALLNAIYAKAKTLADAAQLSADSALTNAATAQTTANNAATAAANAQTSANTANTAISNIVSDSVLDSSEKPSQRAEWDVIAAEKSGINTQAASFAVTTENTTYNNAFQALANYLNAGTTWVSGVPSWLADANLGTNTTIVGATYRSTWATFYAARTALLNAITAKVKTLADTAQTAANSAQTTANGRIRSFYQTTAPTASAIGDLWVDTDDNNRMYRWNGTSWVDAADSRISSVASSVTALQTTVGTHTTTLQTQASSIDGLLGQYTVKIDNNGYVSGFGLASTPKDGTPYSEFVISANTFKFGAPDGSKTPFAVVDIGGGVYKTLLNSDVIIGGNVDIANLNAGSLRNDVKLRLGDGMIDLDGAGEIRVYKSLAANADYVKLSAGELRFMRYISGAYQTYNYLSRLETGIANSGDTVTIPGYWKSQPKVMVSPAMLGLYKKDYANQDQAINCQALNTRETAAGSGQWMFDAMATLSLAASSGGTALNISSGTITSNTFTTATQTTPANCTSITPSFSLTSVRGTGSSQYYRRSVRWRVEYYSGGTWVAGTWNAVNEGDQLGSVTASGTFTFPSAGTWQWRIAYEAYDTDGTVFGAVSYQYSTETLRMNGSKAIQTYNSSMLRVPADGPESGDGSTLTAAYSGFASDGGSVSLSGTTSKAYITTSSSGALYAQHINNDGSPSSSTDFASNYSMAANTRTAFNLGTGMSIPAFSSTWVQNAYSNARVSNFQGTAGSTITMELEYDPNIVANLVAFKICPTNSSFQYSYLKVRIAPSVTNTSWEIYKIEYSWKRKMGNSADGVSATFTAVGPDGVTDSQSGSVGYPSQAWVQKGVTFTGNNLSYARDYLKVKINANGSYTNAYIMRDVTAVIYRRTPVTNTTTPSNTFILNSYTYDLSSAQVLATGSMNWMAVGE